MKIEVRNYMTSFDIIFHDKNGEVIRIRLRREEFKEIIKQQNVVKVKLEANCNGTNKNKFWSPERTS